MEAALAELFSPHTSADRRRQLQGEVISERMRPAAWTSYRELLLGNGGSEVMLWFVLSLCESALTLHWPLPQPERQQLKADLMALLLGPAAQQSCLPASARGKALQCLAVLARWEWPGEDAAAVSNALQLLGQPGEARRVGARLLRAMAEEFDPKSHRSTWRHNEQLQAAFSLAMPEVWAALGVALSGDETGSGGALQLALEACRALLSSAPLGGPSSRAGQPAAMLQCFGALLLPSAADAAVACAALDCVAELADRQAPEVGPLLTPLLPPLGCLLQQLSAARPPFGLGAVQLEALEERLCYCLGLLAERWLITIAPHAAAPVLQSLWTYSAAGASLAQSRRCVRVTVTFLEAASAADALVVGHEIIDQLAEGLLPAVSQLLGLLLASANASLEVDPADEAQWADRIAAAPSEEGLDEADEADEADACEGEDDEGFAGCVAEVGELLRSLAEQRPSAYLAAVGTPLPPLLAAFTAASGGGAGEGGGGEGGGALARALFDLGTLVALLRGVVALVPRHEAVGLTRLLLAALPPLPPAPSAPPPPPSPLLWRAELSLLALLRLQCAGLAADADADAASAQLLSGCLGALCSRALRLVRTAPSAAGGRAAAALLVAVCAVRWPLSVREALAELREQPVALAEAAPAARRPELLAAASLALLLPPKAPAPSAATEPVHAARFGEVVAALAAPWGAAQGGGGAAADMPTLLREVPLRAACLRAICDALKDGHRAVLDTALGALAPTALPALQALLGAVLQLQPRPLRQIAALLRLLLAAISTFGRMLGAAFVSAALHGTVSAVDGVLAELAAAAAAAGGAEAADARGLEALLSVSLRLLRLAAEPPLSKAAERAALTEQVLAACKPGRMGWLLGGAADVSPALRLQVFDVAARVLQAHWQSLREREEELSNLLQLLACGLARPADLEPFRRCLGAFQNLWQLALRPQQRRAEAPPWLKQRASEWLHALMTLRLDQTHAAVHAEMVQLLHGALVTDVAQMEPAQRPAELLPLLQRSLAATAELGDDERRELLETFSQNDVRDFSTFKLCTDRLANDVAYLQKRRRACLQQQQAVM